MPIILKQLHTIYDLNRTQDKRVIYCGCHGNLVSIATRYVANVYYHSFSVFGTVANGTLPGSKYICSPLKSKDSILGFC